MKSGYNGAVNSAREKLKNLTPEKVCGLCGVKFDGEKYLIKWLSGEREICLDTDIQPGYSKTLEIILLHYLISEGTKRPEGKLISYREVPGALFYEPKFIQRTVAPLVKCFGGNPGALVETGKIFGGVEVNNKAGYAVKIDLLPYLPVTYTVCGGDEEFEPSGTVLFDRTAPGWLNAEDLTVAASLGAYELIAKYKSLYK
ncbi:MAG: DUF3786 domain-containing protein [Oscillospiraceae bacterium]|nr:DUF3786 domain-containing protein [Oscillospiraceae bacterium]